MKKISIVLVSIISTFIFCDVLLWHILYDYTYSKSDLKFDMSHTDYEFRSEFRYFINHPEYFSDNFNIVMIGDSFTYGHSLDNQETISFLLEQKLMKLNPLIRVHNAGVNAANSVDNFLILKHILKTVRPSLIIFTSTSNDPLFTEFNIDKHLACKEFSENDKGVLYKLAQFSNIFYYIYHRDQQFTANESKNYSRFQQCSLEYIKKSDTLMKPYPHFFSFHFAEGMENPYCKMTSENLNHFRNYLSNKIGIDSIFITDSLIHDNCSKLKSYYSDDGYHFNINGNKKITDMILGKILSSREYTKKLKIQQ